MTSRRRILKSALATATLAVLSSGSRAQDKTSSKIEYIATNSFPWERFAKQRGLPLQLHSQEMLADIAATGMQGYEPNIRSLNDFDGLKERLASNRLEMRSIYVNSVLHDKDKSPKSIDEVLAIAERAHELGTRTLVTNPSPIRWGGAEDKTDQQIEHQAIALNELGEKLRKVGIELAYHNHDAELRQGGREFHHMLTATDPDNVKFCLDAHWIYRGCGNSHVALFDTIEHYKHRIVELHLRQSRDGIWTEAFSFDGDLDYRRLLRLLNQLNIQPLIVLEQAIEPKSVVTVSVLEAHRMSFNNLKQFRG